MQLNGEGKEADKLAHLFAQFILSCGYCSKLSFNFAHKFVGKKKFIEVFRQLSLKVFDVKV